MPLKLYSGCCVEGERVGQSEDGRKWKPCVQPALWSVPGTGNRRAGREVEADVLPGWFRTWERLGHVCRSIGRDRLRERLNRQEEGTRDLETFLEGDRDPRQSCTLPLPWEGGGRSLAETTERVGRGV